MQQKITVLTLQGGQTGEGLCLHIHGIYAGILRSVAENEYKEDYYIFLEDDRILMRDYHTLIRTCQRLDADGELRIFQMFYKIFEKYRSHINTVAY